MMPTLLLVCSILHLLHGSNAALAPGRSSGSTYLQASRSTRCTHPVLSLLFYHKNPLYVVLNGDCPPLPSLTTFCS